MAIEEDDLLEAVVGQRLDDIEDAADEVLVVAVHGAGEVHDMAAVAVPVGRQDQHLARDLLADAVGDALWANNIDIQRQVRPVLLDRADGQDADLAQLDGVVDLGPGELFVAEFSSGTRHGRLLGVCDMAPR